jgi:CRP-like cAMP-binding protein
MAELAHALPPEGQNALLEALGHEAGEWLSDRLSEVELEVDQVLEAQGGGVDGLYFPVTCLLCRLVSVPEGTSVKVSIVGREGMAGTSALVDVSLSAFRTVVQLPGRALFLPRRDAVRLLAVPGVAAIVVRYLLLLVRETSLMAACNRVHPARERLARWLLLISDRMGLREFPLTHESLAAMLGVRRESVTLSANELRDAGAIEYRRAAISIVDRQKLKRQSCSCYPAVTEAYVRLLTSELPDSTQARS